MPYEILPTTADFAVKGWGRTIKELFSSLGRGMFAGSCGCEISEDKGREGDAEYIDVQGIDYEELLINFLNELIYRYSTKKRFYWAFDLIIKDLKLTGKAYGRPVETIDVELKAATYHNLKVIKSEKGWEATVVFDI